MEVTIMSTNHLSVSGELLNSIILFICQLHHQLKEKLFKYSIKYSNNFFYTD